jgi:hypothetical protein
MNDKMNAQTAPATPDSSGKTPPVDPDCCSGPGGGDPGPTGPTG